MKHILKQPEQKWMRLHSTEEGDTFILAGNAICDISDVYMRLDYASMNILPIPNDFIAVIRLSDGKFETLPFETKIVHVSPTAPIKFQVK